jgi:hypothetical protein
MKMHSQLPKGGELILNDELSWIRKEVAVSFTLPVHVNSVALRHKDVLSITLFSFSPSSSSYSVHEVRPINDLFRPHDYIPLVVFLTVVHDIPLSSSSLITGFLSPGASPLEPMVHPHHSGFKFQTVALCLLCAMSLVQLFSCGTSVECFPGLVYRYFSSPLVTPMITGMTNFYA